MSANLNIDIVKTVLAEHFSGILGATLVDGRGELYAKSDEHMAIELKCKGKPKKMNP